MLCFKNNVQKRCCTMLSKYKPKNTNSEKSITNRLARNLLDFDSQWTLQCQSFHLSFRYSILYRFKGNTKWAKFPHIWELVESFGYIQCVEALHLTDFKLAEFDIQVCLFYLITFVSIIYKKIFLFTKQPEIELTEGLNTSRRLRRSKNFESWARKRNIERG